MMRIDMDALNENKQAVESYLQLTSLVLTEIDNTWTIDEAMASIDTALYTLNRIHDLVEATYK